MPFRFSCIHTQKIEVEETIHQTEYNRYNLIPNGALSHLRLLSARWLTCLVTRNAYIR